MADQQHGDMASPKAPDQGGLASTTDQPSDEAPNAQPDSKRKRSTSPSLCGGGEQGPNTSTNEHGTNDKRARLDTGTGADGPCQLRCGYPLDSALHQHRPWCHQYVPVVETRVDKIFDELLTKCQPHLPRVSKSVSAKCESIRANKDIKRCYQEPKPTVVVGETGSGKSKLVSYLVGCPGISKVSASRRGTHTIIEFRGRFEDQKHRFVLKVLLQTPAQIKSRLLGHLRTIYTYLMMVKMETSKDDNKPDDGEVDEQVEKYDSAYEMLHTTLHGSVLTLKIKGTTKEHKVKDLEAFQEFLDSSFDDCKRFEDSDPEGTSAMLCDRMVQFMVAQGISNNAKICAVDTFGHLQTAMYDTIQPLSAGTQHLWPLVRKAILHCKGIDLLEMGVSIGDTAGFADANEFVVNNSLSYLADAGTILLVAPVSRIASRKDLNTHLSRSIAMNKIDSIHIVATHADTLDSELEESQRKSISAEDKARVSSAEEQEKQLEAEIKDMEGEKEKLEAQDSEARSSIDKKTADLQDRKAKATREKVRAVRQIEKRNIEQQLKPRLRKLNRAGHGPDLNVFFTTTEGLDSHYKEDGQNMCDDPLLDTGLPAIAQLLFDKSARERFDLLSRTCTVRLPSDLEAILTMLTKSPTQVHQDVRARIVITIDKGIESVLTALGAELNSRITSQLEAAFSDVAKKGWTSKAEALLDVWETWNARTVHTFCRRMGLWRQPGTSDQISWTSIIQDIFAATVASAFDEIDLAGLSIVENLTSKVEEFIFMPLKDDAMLASVGADSDAFAKTIVALSGEFSIDMKDLADQLKCFLDNIRSHTIVDNTDSYINEELQSTFIKAAAFNQKNYTRRPRKAGKPKKGESAFADRIHTIREKLCKTGDLNIFERMQSRAETGLGDVSSEWFRNVAAKLEEVKMAVLEYFDSKHESHEEAREIDPDAVQAVRDAALRAKKRLEKRVLPLLKEREKLNDRAPKVEVVKDD